MMSPHRAGATKYRAGKVHTGSARPDTAPASWVNHQFGGSQMFLAIGRSWFIAIVVTTVAATVGGLLVVAVQRVRRAAERTSDT
jgi:ABC-type spermidine/putrescine transport system permease subunit II